MMRDKTYRIARVEEALLVDDDIDLLRRLRIVRHVGVGIASPGRDRSEVWIVVRNVALHGGDVGGAAMKAALKKG